MTIKEKFFNALKKIEKDNSYHLRRCDIYTDAQFKDMFAPYGLHNLFNSDKDWHYTYKIISILYLKNKNSDRKIGTQIGKYAVQKQNKSIQNKLNIIMQTTTRKDLYFNGMLLSIANILNSNDFYFDIDKLFDTIYYWNNKNALRMYDDFLNAKYKDSM
jgi:hypothetical protein